MLLVEKYEEEHYPLPSSDPIETIKFLMKKKTLTRKYLEPYPGTRARVSEVLNKKRILTLLSEQLYNANPFDASIVLVLHGDEIPFFAVKNYDKYQALMQRAKSLTDSGPIEFRMCRIAAEGHGFEPGDIHCYVKVVPMADAEIVRVQQEEGYVYMR